MERGIGMVLHKAICQRTVSRGWVLWAAFLISTSGKKLAPRDDVNKDAGVCHFWEAEAR